MATRTQEEVVRGFVARVPVWALAIFFSMAAQAAQVQLNVGLGQPVLSADKKQTTYLKVGLTGFALENPAERAPVNVAIVLDRSGSMEGEKLAKAKEAAFSVLDRLNANDILAVVVFDNTVQVIVPATKLTDKGSVRAAIANIRAGNTTALFAGVSKGAEEVRKFIDRERVNRIILISDGIANVGPSSPSELGALGHSLRKEGIAVTTIGLGLDYNEDLMEQLARRSDANHYFVKSAGELPEVMNREFGGVLTVVAEEVSIKINCAEGIRPVRLLGREGEICGQEVCIQLNQLYSRQEKFAMLEIEVPPAAEGQTQEIASVKVSYHNLATNTIDKLSSSISAGFSRAKEVVESKEDRGVMVDAITLLANENNKRATWLRDQGRVDEARDALNSNSSFLRANNVRYKDKVLERDANLNDSQATQIDDTNWGTTRKGMRYNQSLREMQSGQ